MSKTLHAGGRAIAVLLVAAVVWVVLAPTVRAQQVEVGVTILRKSWSNCDDDISVPDIFNIVTIDGVAHYGPTDSSNFSYWDVEQRYLQDVDLAKGVINVSIQQKDDDDSPPFDTGTETCDVLPDGRDVLNFALDLNACTFSGDVSGSCGDRIEIEHFTDDYQLVLHFAVAVEQPSAAPGLNVQCTHSPIWPQPGQDVTITLNALDGLLVPKLANNLEIWVNDRTVPVATGPGSTLSVVVPAVAGTDFHYGCQATAGAEVAWTGWRNVAIGESALTNAYGRRVPLMFQGPRRGSIDFVFYHDRDSYTSATDPNFLNAISSTINAVFFSDPLYLANQHVMNFWLAVNSGDAENDCEFEVVNQRLWEDASVILHTDVLRDCSDGDDRILTAEVTEPAVIAHELGHVPFGLADEYCCDGGYFEQRVFPNLYEERADADPPAHGCVEDAATLGRSESACRSFDEVVDWWFDNEWWTSDPGDSTPGGGNDDLMVDNGPRQLLDLRRYNFIFLACRSSLC